MTERTKGGKAKPEKRKTFLDELVPIIGKEATLQLAIHFGGIKCYVPAQPSATCELAATITQEKAILLAKRYGGVILDIPQGDSRRHLIHGLLDRGLSVRAVAREVRCTERYVYDVRAERRRATAE